MVTQEFAGVGPLPAENHHQKSPLKETEKLTVQNKGDC
jgi:hypothetical protein